MKHARELVTSTVIGGVFIVVPLYLALLLLLKGMKSAAGLVRPIAVLLPDWLPAEEFFSLVLVLVACFFVGAAVRTQAGRIAREKLERVFFERLPGYGAPAQSDAAIGGGRRREGVEACTRGARGRARPVIHHRGARRRTAHGVRAVGADTAGRGCVHPRSRACAPGRCPLHSGNPIRLALGLGVERARRGNAASLTGPLAGHLRNRIRKSARTSRGGVRQ